MVDEENTTFCTLRIPLTYTSARLAFGLPSPLYDDFVRGVARARYFTLAVEGVIPVRVNLSAEPCALDKYVTYRGWM